MKKTLLLFAVLLTLVSFTFAGGCDKSTQKKQAQETAWQQEWMNAVQKVDDCLISDESCEKAFDVTLKSILSKPRSFTDLAMMFEVCRFCGDSKRDIIRREMIKVAKTPDELAAVYNSFIFNNDDFNEKERNAVAKKIINDPAIDFDEIKRYCRSTFSDDVSSRELAAARLMKMAKTIPDLVAVVTCSGDASSEQGLLAIKKMMQMAKTFEDWRLVYSVVNNHSVEEGVSFNKMVCLADSFDEWHDFYRSVNSDFDRAILLKKLFASAEKFSDWERVFYIVSDGDKATRSADEKLVFSKMMERAKTPSDWETVYEYAPDDSAEKELAIKKGQEFIEKAGCK